MAAAIRLDNPYPGFSMSNGAGKLTPNRSVQRSFPMLTRGANPAAPKPSFGGRHGGGGEQGP
jgi:hypothetical protein